jgi:hypothetical protein
MQDDEKPIDMKIDKMFKLLINMISLHQYEI